MRPIYSEYGIYTIQLPLNSPPPLRLPLCLTFWQYVYELCVVERLLYRLITNSLKVIGDADYVAYYTLVAHQRIFRYIKTE